MTKRLLKIFLFTSLYYLVTARYLDNDQNVPTAPLDGDNQLSSPEMRDCKETKQKIKNNPMTKSQINSDLMPQPKMDDFQMAQPEVNQNIIRCCLPAMEHTEVTVQKMNLQTLDTPSLLYRQEAELKRVSKMCIN